MHTDLNFKNCRKSEGVVNFVHGHSRNLSDNTRENMDLQVTIEKLGEREFVTRLTVNLPKSLGNTVAARDESIYCSVAEAFKKSGKIVQKRIDKFNDWSLKNHRQSRDKTLETLAQKPLQPIDAETIIQMEKHLQSRGRRIEPTPPAPDSVNKTQLLGALNEYKERLQFTEFEPGLLKDLNLICSTIRKTPSNKIKDAFSAGSSLMSQLNNGDALSLHIGNFFESGDFTPLEAIRKVTPTDYQELLTVPGVGLGRASAFFRDLGVCNKKQLLDRAKSGELTKVKLVGRSLEEQIIKFLDPDLEAGPSQLVS